MEEARFVGIRVCSHCNEALALLLPGRQPRGLDGDATALGVRVERAVAAFLDQDRDAHDGMPSLVQCLLDLWRERGEVPSRFVLDREQPGLLMGTLFLRGPTGITTVRCTPGEGVLIAVDLGLPCMIDDSLVGEKAPDVFHRIAWRGCPSSLH